MKLDYAICLICNEFYIERYAKDHQCPDDLENKGE